MNCENTHIPTIIAITIHMLAKVERDNISSVHN